MTMANKENSMREVRIEKIILSCGGVKDELEKSIKLLKKISKKTPVRKMTSKRIPTFGIRPKLEVGCMVTLRGNEAKTLLKRLLAAVENKLRKKQIQENFFSFGIAEYIEIPGEEYDREIGMIGFSTTVVFSRKGRRVLIRKIKRSKISKKQHVSKQEIIKFMEENFNTKIK